MMPVMVRRWYGFVWLAALAASSPACPADSRDRDPRPPGAANDDWRAAIAAWRYPEPIPDLALVDHRGHAFRLGELARAHVLVGFVYTRCPIARACPLTVERMQRVHQRWRQLARDGVTRGRTLEMLALTLDPAHDTPERLAAFARERGLTGDAWTLATGPVDLMQSGLPSLFNVLALPRGPGDIGHTVKIALLAPGLIVAKEWKDDAFSVQDVIDAILEQDTE